MFAARNETAAAVREQRINEYLNKPEVKLYYKTAKTPIWSTLDSEKTALPRDLQEVRELAKRHPDAIVFNHQYMVLSTLEEVEETILSYYLKINLEDAKSFEHYKRALEALAAEDVLETTANYAEIPRRKYFISEFLTKYSAEAFNYLEQKEITTDAFIRRTETSPPFNLEGKKGLIIPAPNYDHAYDSSFSTLLFTTLVKEQSLSGDYLLRAIKSDSALFPILQGFEFHFIETNTPDLTAKLLNLSFTNALEEERKKNGNRWGDFKPEQAQLSLDYSISVAIRTCVALNK